MSKLYQIHLRQFLNQKNCSLVNFPLEFLDYLQSLNFNYLWLMGIWQLPKNPKQLEFSYQSFLIDKYNKTLPDWTRGDIISSVFAIDKYSIDDKLGTINDYLFLKTEANKRGIKIILDYIPNHFGLYSSLVETDSHLFLKINNIIQSGKDPNYPAWSDTAQLDYTKQTTRDFMIKELLKISDICDGVRIDMAMLLIDEVFINTWQIESHSDNSKTQIEFWSQALISLKQHNPNFITIGECYWDLEEKLINLGFNYTYYKPFLDSLISNNQKLTNDSLNHNLKNQLVFFLENHDEKRSADIWNLEELKVKINLFEQTSGIKLYYHGQLEGNKIFAPIQLIKTPIEETNQTIKDYYKNNI